MTDNYCYYKALVKEAKELQEHKKGKLTIELPHFTQDQFEELSTDVQSFLIEQAQTLLRVREKYD